MNALRSFGRGWLALCLLAGASELSAQDTSAVRVQNDSIIVRFVDADLRAVLQVLGRYMDRPVLAAGLPQVRVTVETPRPIPRSGVLPLLRGVIESQNLELVTDSAFYRVRQREAVQVAAPPAGGQQGPAALELTVVRLRHARAADVAATLGALYGAAGSALGGGRPGTLSDELRRNVVPPFVPSQQAGGEQPVQQQRSAALEGAVTIVPDPITNALLIRASRRDAAILLEAVRELDLRPLQVLVEVVIAEARRDRLASWGLDIFMPARQLNPPGNATVEVGQQGGGLGDLVIQFMNLGRAEVDAILRMGATRGDVQILSRPVLLVANNQQARFLVGSQRPFVQVSRSLPTDAPTRDQVIQYKDVGTRLTIRPSIGADGYVTMDIIQEVSSATTETAFDAPVISTREATTQVLVRDSQTIVLGGLIDHQRDVNSGGIPFLSDLPLIGGLFGRQSIRSTETELFLFLTPRVLRTDSDVEGVTNQYRETPKPR